MTKRKIEKEINKLYSDNIAYKNLPKAYQFGMKIFKQEVVNFISSNTLLADSCRFYEQDNTTAMNCKHCGKSKWMHGNGNLR